MCLLKGSSTLPRNKNFVDKAPKEVVEKDTAKLEDFKVKREKLEQSLKMLG
jgi:valyl-tRNA synthetase